MVEVWELVDVCEVGRKHQFEVDDVDILVDQSDRIWFVRHNHDIGMSQKVLQEIFDKRRELGIVK